MCSVPPCVSSRAAATAGLYHNAPLGRIAGTALRDQLACPCNKLSISGKDQARPV